MWTPDSQRPVMASAAQHLHGKQVKGSCSPCSGNHECWKWNHEVTVGDAEIHVWVSNRHHRNDNVQYLALSQEKSSLSYGELQCSCTLAVGWWVSGGLLSLLVASLNVFFLDILLLWHQSTWMLPFSLFSSAVKLQWVPALRSHRWMLKMEPEIRKAFSSPHCWWEQAQ